MNVIEEAIRLAMQLYNSENDEPLEDDEEFATLFNDGVLIIGRENSRIQAKFLLGKPNRINFNLGMTESEPERYEWEKSEHYQRYYK